MAEYPLILRAIAHHEGSTVLTKTELKREIAAETELHPQDVQAVLDALVQIGKEELEDGEDFNIHGLVRLTYRYTTPRKKGDEYKGFGGEIMKAEKARPAAIKLKAAPHVSLTRAVPDTKSKVGKYIAQRKTAKK